MIKEESLNGVIVKYQQATSLNFTFFFPFWYLDILSSFWAKTVKSDKQKIVPWLEKLWFLKCQCRISGSISLYLFDKHKGCKDIM